MTVLRDGQGLSSDRAHRVVCRQVVELLGEYLEGALDDQLQTDVRLHLEACPECLTFVDQLRISVSLVGALPSPDELPEPTVEVLIRTFRALTPA